MRGIASNSAELGRIVDEVYGENHFPEFELDRVKEMKDGIYFVNFGTPDYRIAVYVQAKRR